MKPLRALLVGGPSYEPLYRTLGDFTRRSGIPVETVVTRDHPELNARIAREYAQGTATYDLISTHTKYAPGQQAWLTPLPELETELDDFMPAAVQLAKIDQQLYSVPRNFDVKLLYWRTDLMAQPPTTWDDLLSRAAELSRPPAQYGFAFPGSDSGLFGHFFELQAMAGGQLFGEHHAVHLDNDAGRWALGLLQDACQLGASPPQTPDWQYDDVARCFREGRAALATDWPGGFWTYNDPALSTVTQRYDLALYPSGPAGRSVYAGSHTFAVPISTQDRPAALTLLRYLVAPAQQAFEARQGSFPARLSALQTVQAEAQPASLEARRWALLHQTAAFALVPPRFARYPQVETALWQHLRRALTGELSVQAALIAAQDAARAALQPATQAATGQRRRAAGPPEER